MKPWTEIIRIAVGTAEVCYNCNHRCTENEQERLNNCNIPVGILWYKLSKENVSNRESLQYGLKQECAECRPN